MIEIKGKYTNAKIFTDNVEEAALQQVYEIVNSAAFEGQKVICCPDIHAGKSGPCGLVATIGNYVCPEHVGVDIGCEVSLVLLSSPIPAEKYAEFEHKVKTRIPLGMEIHGRPIIDEKDFRRFLTSGFSRYRSQWPEMLDGLLPDMVTEEWLLKTLRRIGMDEGVFYKSLGTIGAGNHVIEYDEGDGLSGVLLHFGSRNFGVKVCEYWMKRTDEVLSREEIKELTKAYKKKYTEEHGKKSMKHFKDDLDAYIDRHKKESGRIPGYLNGDKMKAYIADLCLAQLYAAYNHMTVKRVILEILGKWGIKEDRTIISVHNFIDVQDHTLRKSAIRAHEGEELVIPFNMRDGLIIGVGKGNVEWLNACAHGAGRKMSRSKAKETLTMTEYEETMKGIYSTSITQGTIDEAPMAYKDTEEILEAIKPSVEVKARLYPKINIKGENKIKYGNN